MSASVADELDTPSQDDATIQAGLSEYESLAPLVAIGLAGFVVWQIVKIVDASEISVVFAFVGSTASAALATFTWPRQHRLIPGLVAVVSGVLVFAVTDGPAPTLWTSLAVATIVALRPYFPGHRLVRALPVVLAVLLARGRSESVHDVLYSWLLGSQAQFSSHSTIFTLGPIVLVVAAEGLILAATIWIARRRGTRAAPLPLVPGRWAVGAAAALLGAWILTVDSVPPGSPHQSARAVAFSILNGIDEQDVRYRSGRNWVTADYRRGNFDLDINVAARSSPHLLRWLTSDNGDETLRGDRIPGSNHSLSCGQRRCSYSGVIGQYEIRASAGGLSRREFSAAIKVALDIINN